MLAANRMDDDLGTGVQVRDGKVVHAQLAKDTGR